MSDVRSFQPVVDQADGLSAGGTASTAAMLVAGEFNTSLPTITNGQQVALQIDANGRPIVTQGGPATLANAWPHKITDGTNGPVAVKAASTAPVATDPALVVTLSPNSSPLNSATGSGTINALNGTVVATGGSALTWSMSGTWVGTISTQAQSGDGQWWSVASLSNQSGLITNGTSINGVLEMNGAGWTQARVIATAWTSGTATVTWNSTTGSHLIIPYSSNPANMNVTSYLDDGSGNAITSTLINSKQRLDINIPSEGADGSTAPFYSTQVAGKDGSGNLQAILTDTSGNQAVLLKDASGNAINSTNNQAFTRDVINVSSQYRAQSVTTSAAEATGAASRLTNRKLLSITPTNGTIYWGTSNAVTTTTGSPLFANQTLQLSFTDNVPVYVIAAATTDVRIVEAS